LGTPGKSATIQTCAIYDDDGTPTQVCSSYKLTVSRTTGKPKVQNATRELLYIYVDIGEGLKRYPLFSDEMYGYFWDYDNKGLRIAQLWFVDISTTVD
jgi:hypothetical protein